MQAEQITVPNARFLRNEPYGRLFEWQRDWLAHFDRGYARFSILEIHRRARKTSTAINLLIRECDLHPKCRYVYVGPTYAETRRIIWDDPNMLREALPDKRVLGWKPNEHHMIVKFANGSIIQFVGGDDPDNLRGIDAQGFVFDEWAQQKEECWTEVLQPIFRQSKERWVAFLYTPKGDNHATVMFDRACCLGDGGRLPVAGRAEKMRPNWYAARLIASKSGIIPAEELAEAQRETPRSLYMQEYECSRIAAEEMTLITSEMLHELNERTSGLPEILYEETRKIVSIDPAFGGDVCKLMGLENDRVKMEQDIRAKHRVGEIVMAAKVMADRLGTRNFIVDDIGNNVADALKEDAARYNVQAFNSAESASPSEATRSELQHVNRRAEAYYYTADKIRRCEVGPITSQRLMRGLPIASRYTVQSKGKLLMQPKTKIKEALGRSPDEEDCYIMGIWGLQHVMPEGQENRRFYKSHRPRSAMA